MTSDELILGAGQQALAALGFEGKATLKHGPRFTVSVSTPELGTYEELPLMHAVQLALMRYNVARMEQWPGTPWLGMSDPLKGDDKVTVYAHFTPVTNPDGSTLDRYEVEITARINHGGVSYSFTDLGRKTIAFKKEG